jgi:hypothetical protein
MYEINLQRLDQLRREYLELCREGRYEQAELLIYRASDQIHQYLGENHPYYATSLSDIGLL